MQEEIDRLNAELAVKDQLIKEEKDRHNAELKKDRHNAEIQAA